MSLLINIKPWDVLWAFLNFRCVLWEIVVLPFLVLSHGRTSE